MILRNRGIAFRIGYRECFMVAEFYFDALFLVVRILQSEVFGMKHRITGNRTVFFQFLPYSSGLFRNSIRLLDIHPQITVPDSHISGKAFVRNSTVQVPGDDNDEHCENKYGQNSRIYLFPGYNILQAIGRIHSKQAADPVEKTAGCSARLFLKAKADGPGG